MVTANDIGQFN